MRSNTFTVISRTTFLAASVVVGISAYAQAQENVSVDLSVLSDGGYQGSQSSAPASGDLMMPGATTPKSSYFGPAVTVTNPVPAPAPIPEPEPVLTEADAVPPPAPEPAPAAPEPVTAEIAPAPEPEITEAPALPPEPEVVAEQPEPAAEDSSAAETETATATSGPTALEPGRAMQVVFDGAETKLSANGKGDLDAIAATVGANEDLRIQLMAYAGGDDLSSSKARRMSLSRALAVRSYFIEQGVRSTRIDVRALGDKTDEEPLNRVDVNITER
jgi:outer membrane protein OmpA-like peptidoglycan-associated protein